MKIRDSAIFIYLIFFATIFFSSCNRNNKREIISLNGEWKFATDSTGIGNRESWPRKAIAESIGIKVQVPHAWNTMHTLEKYWGKAWYERSIYLSSDVRNKAVRIQFDAVYHDAKIWINGKFAGSHIGSGYNRFYIRADSLIIPGSSNRITVLADNSPSHYSIPYNKSFDWSNDGGIIRNVELIITEKEAIAAIHVIGIPNRTNYKDGVTKIDIDFLDELKCESNEVTLSGVIEEFNQPTNQTIWKGKLDGLLQGTHYRTELNLKNIKCWHFDHPNLYKLRVRLKVRNIYTDEFSATFGFRTIEMTSTHFILNGEPIRIAGIEWMPGSDFKFGMAEPERQLAINLNLMKKANAVFTRFHWEQDEYIFNWCDRNGILVQEEIPYWGAETMLNDDLFTLGKSQLKEMLDANFNHPCIISWGIGNELASHDSSNIRYIRGLYTFAKNYDSSRLVNYVSNQLNVPLHGKAKILPDAGSVGDVLMFNEYYSTWYNQRIDSVPNALNKIHADYPNKALVISEFGMCEPVFKGGDPRRIIEMREQFKLYGAKPYIAGAIYFCLNDYRTHMGEDFTYSYPQRVHGVVDIKLNPKPSYNQITGILSPLEIISIKKQDGIARLSLHCKTGLPAYSVSNYMISTSREKMPLDNMKPGDEKLIEISFNKKADTLKIVRPTGFEIIRLPL
jgi:beta-galactosidase